MGKILGIDYGTVRIGLATADQTIALPWKTLSAGKTIKDSAMAIFRAVEGFAPIEKLVIGFPLLLNGKESPLCAQVRDFAQALEEILHIPYILWDERLSSAQIERLLKEAEVTRKKRKGITDSLAATIFLQSYLDSPYSTQPG
eukprot:Opistho-1_new@27240